ncbi:hypothetical protein C9374_001944 [Naegleria lovaniensis]|uniref:Uncharacterized protein n=1 Tax=Naegleria lovaniensis TaxID=51637 RepID=A0AA88GVG7_NAELO|nr:uncharacterized protein C9374_001944 [Naegleria lovaniensis]KAG2386909.1 hypothetical protein C9374_001944 [Naegleria lovaniensis]
MNQNQQTPPSANTPTTPATSSNMNSNAPSQASRIMTNSLTLPNSHHHASLSSSSPLQNSSNLATMNSSPSSVKSSSLSPLAVAQPSSIATTFISTNSNNNNNNRPVSTPVIPPFNQTSMKYSNHPSSIMVETTTHDDKKDDTMTTNSPCMRISLPSTPSSSLFTTPTTTCSFSSNGFSPSSISTDALVPMTTSLFSNTPLPVAAETKKKKSKEDDDQDTKKRKKKSSDSVDIKKESTPKKKKKKQADQPQEPLIPSSSPTAMEISKSKDALSNTEMMKQIYFGKIPKQLTLRICCLMDGETEVDKDIVSEENGNILIDGNKFLNELIEWKGALDDSKKFFRFHAAFVLTAMSPDDITSFADLVDSMKEALQSCECSEGLYDLRRDTKIYNETLEYQYNTESSTIQIIMKRKSFIEEIATIIYKMVSRQEEEEMEEVIEQETQVKETTEELTLIFTFSLENNPKKKYNIELKTPKSTNYKKVICENLRLFENDIQKYTEKDETTIYASGILPKSFMNALAGRVDVNVVHRHVFYEQRVISHTLYERMKSIIGQTNFEQFNHLCFLVCTPDQNTLWYQTMERLERANILPPNTKLTSVSIKYRKDHLPIFEAFRNRIEKEQDTLFIVIADECHFAITKDGAHDNIVNDALALKHNNFFVLLVSATPYNVISVDSNVPEVYELKQQILKDTGNHNGVENIELIYDKEEYLQQVKVLTGKIGDFSVDDIVHYDESNHMLISHTSDKQLQIELSTREKKKINYSKNIFKLKKPIGNLQVADKSFVEIFDTVKWMVTFCPVDNPSLQVSMNDWEFRKYTEYEEYNVICWHDVQKRTILERTAQDFQTKRYFSKQDYINSIKSGEDLVLKDVEFESILRNVKAASITLRPIMLAIDYHFWFIFQAVDHKLCTISEAFNHFLSIDTISTTDEHKLYVSLCKLLYVFYMAQKYGGLKKVEKVFENEYLDDEDNVFEEKKTKKQKKQDLKSGLKLMNEKLKKTFERKKKKVKESFEKMMSVRVSGNSHTGKLVHDLLESGKINGSKSISGQMKILRITTTEFANTVVSMLKFSVTKLASLSGYILPDVLIDTGEKPLTLDQLSVVTRLKLAEKILSTEDYELFQKNPARLSKEKKSLEYINLQNFPCILILVAKGRQGDTFPQSFDCLDMRAKGDSLPNYSSFTQEFGRLCRYIDDTDKKPIALVTDAIYKDLDKCKNGTSMGNTNMKLDAYMIKMKKTSGQKYWIWSHIAEEQCKLWMERRLVLFAEPQIGKTDSFLHFLERVIKGIEENRMKRMIDVPDAGEQVEEDETLIVDSVQRDQIEWILPYHYSCQNTLLLMNHLLLEIITSKNNGLADMSYTRAVNIVQHTEIYEFDMPSILDDIFPKVKPKMSIPNNKKHWFRFSDPQKICGVTSLTDRNDIRSWIFMPSYNRSACGLFYLNSILNAHYRQVVVVRSQEFNCYRDLIGSDFVIMSLPDVIDLKKLTSLCNKKEIISRSAQYTNNVEDKTIVDYELKDDIGGAGFSRLTIQILAYAMQLEFVWMMDDNCHHFEKVTNTQKTPCSLEEVLLPIESIVYDEAQPLKNFTQTLNGKVSRNDPTQLLTLNDPVKYFTPGKEKIAMIGIRKDAYRYNPGLHYKPFLNSTTICSLFLLNVKVTFDHGILFPCRKYQEDIEFEYLCAEKGLYCIKSQKYFLHKPSNPIRIESNANKPCIQAKPQPQPLSQEYQLLRNAISTGIDWTDGPGKFSNLMTSENDIGKEFWLFLTNDYLIRYNKTITNAPEILEQQYPELLFDVTYFTPQKENIQELIIRLVIRRK